MDLATGGESDSRRHLDLPYQSLPAPVPGHTRHHSESRLPGPVGLGPECAVPPVNNGPTLSEFDLDKIEMFYRSHKTFVFVGQCAAGLYLTQAELVDGGRSSRPAIHGWKFLCAGVPVLIFNKGDTRSRDKRQIEICLAERGTGFRLWHDVIDNLSNYSAVHSSFHTMYLSADHRQMAGLSFDNQQASLDFYRKVESIVSNPLNISLTGPKKKGDDKFRLFRRARSKSVGRSEQRHSDCLSEPACARRKTPTKQDISRPCLFQHVTSVNLHNCDQFPSTHTPLPPHYCAPEVTSLSSSASSHGQTGHIRPTGSYSDLNHSAASSSASNVSY